MKRVAAVLIAVFALQTAALAQEELNDNREIKERETANQTMSEPFYKRISAIHELMGVDDTEALSKATILEKNGRTNAYEKALLFQTIGFIHANASKVDQAISYFEKSLAQNALAPEAQQGMLYSLASLYASQEKYRKAITTVREWFEYEADPKPEAYILIASSFAQLEEYNNALPYVKKANQKSKKPQESWHQLELAVYFEEDQIATAVPLLRKMIQYWPDKQTYWETLSGAHMQLNQDRDALSVMMVAYHKGLLDTEDKVLALVKLNMFLDIPYTAGVILDEQLKAGLVERSIEHLELLQSAWAGSQEYPRALAVMTELGDRTNKPSYSIDQAKIYNEQGDWQNVVATAEKALERDYEKPGEAYLLIGTAYSELDQLEKALAAFRSAESVGTVDEKRNARAWIAFVNDRLKVNVLASR
ncbi:MAG: tetratricopeptide repeat protein [Pseudomonadota bacterium]